ncbi:MAG: hypothetical protein ACFE0J_23175 [Elainellaceae cyanobacterium]
MQTVDGQFSVALGESRFVPTGMAIALMVDGFWIGMLNANGGFANLGVALGEWHSFPRGWRSLLWWMVFGLGCLMQMGDLRIWVLRWANHDSPLRSA